MCANVYGGKHLETKVASKVRADGVGASLVPDCMGQKR